MHDQETLDLEQLSPEAITSAEVTEQLVDASAGLMTDRSNCTAAYSPTPPAC